ncbi:DUF1284 domain-containing protein [Paenibacillus xerothermodurans]|uniref:DUF1284 domain-containing protein n=1 Tax=Paenibacillus xerothermodurans TaxID=1977292 RepID=A0A2W1NM38_PAEXE|nr:DUF1284 domain-containing protein [Paenibacillus xerothermodurans]PZE20515.1 DUF1284 domain-containing protein [Paenibacillus xerothermodurans]
MNIRLRGHHVLCLLGYRGKGYSEQFCANMTSIYETLRLHPETLIEIIEGPDDICQAYPADQHPHCHNEGIYLKDAAVLDTVDVELGSVISWEQLCSSINTNVVPDDISRLCANCRWEPLGLCKEGVLLVNEGRKLPAVSG